jgi:hypothetical protein
MTTTAVEPAPGGRRVVTQVPSLSFLVGAHPDALVAIYREGRATDPAELGDAPRGRLLAINPGGELFLLTRPLVRALAKGALPWRGKVFDHGGASGQNVVFGRKVLRFAAEVGPSAIDGRPALLLDYARPAHENPWPVRAIRDELRTVGDGIAIGPALHGVRPLFWFGLEIAR